MEDDQQFCLRWNNHQTTLIQNFDTLLESGTLVDCTLAAEGKYLKAHKVVLSACSPYFEGLLSEHYDKHPVFILKDVKFKELKAMMDYMYRGEVNISQDQLAALLKAAESLQIKGLSESRTGGNACPKPDTRQNKVSSQPTAPSLDIPHASSGLTIEKNNKVPRQSLAQSSVGDLPEDSASPSIPKGLSSREGSQSPVSRKRKRLRRRSVGEDNSVENHESNSSDMTQANVPAMGIAPVADEKSHADPADSLGRSALMQQLTKPADEMLQLPVEKPEPTEDMIQPKSEYLDDPEESVEDLTLDDDMNDLNEMEDSNRAGPSTHDPSQHPGLAAWHVTGDRSNAGGVVGVPGGPGNQDEVFLAAHEAVQAQRDSQEYGEYMFVGEGDQAEVVWECINISDENVESIASRTDEILRQGKLAKKTKKRSQPVREPQVKYLTRSRLRLPEESTKNKKVLECPNKCGSSFFYQHTLEKHVRHICDQPMRYKCPYCSLVSRNRNNLNVHIKFRHPGYKNYVIDTFIGKNEPLFEDEYDTSYEQNIEHSWNEEHEIKILSVSSLAKSEDIKHEFEDFKDESIINKRFSCPNNCGSSYKHEYTLKAHVEFACHQNPALNNLHLEEEESEPGTNETTMMEVTKFESPEELPNPMALAESSEFKNEEGKWVCPKSCGGTFSTRGNLNYHLRTLCGIEPRLECPYCSHRMKQPSNGFTHIKTHHPDAQLCLVDTVTGEIVRRKKDMGNADMTNIDNYTSKTPETKKISPTKLARTCQTCGKVFKLHHTLSRHLAEGCGQPPRFKCPWCDYQVRRLSYAFFHVTKNHPGLKVYMVDLLTGESITDSTQIKKEAVEEVKEEKPLAPNPVHSLRPKRAQTSVPAGLQKKKLMCPRGCGQYFFFQPSLQKHIKYKCRKTSKPFQSTGSARFKCSYCVNSFVHRTSALRHLRTHHRGKTKIVIDTHAEEIVPETAAAKVLERNQERKTQTRTLKTQKEKTDKLPKSTDNQNDTEKTDSNSQGTSELIHCPNKCGSMFEHSFNISRHLRQSCSKVRRFKCPHSQCTYRSQQFNLVGKHIKRTHRLSKIYAYDIFTKQLVYSEPKRRPRSLALPKRAIQEPSASSETEVEQKSDSVVSKTFAKKSKLQSRYPCPNNCGKSFKVERSVDTHLRLICGRSPRYKCPYCIQVCRHQGNITIHINHRHPGRRIYSIDILKKKTPKEVGKQTRKEKQAEEIQEEVEKEQLQIATGSDDLYDQNVPDNETSETVFQPHLMDVPVIQEAKKAKITKMAKKSLPVMKQKLDCPNNCGRSFISTQRLKVHVKSNCKNAPTFKCPYCETVCAHSWNISMHIKHRHPQFYGVNKQQDVGTEEDEKHNEDLTKQNGTGEQLMNVDEEIASESHEVEHLEQSNIDVANDIEEDVEMEENVTEDVEMEENITQEVDNENANQMEATNDVDNHEIPNDEDDDIEFELEDENEIEQETSHVAEANITANISLNTSNSINPTSPKKFPCPNNCGSFYSNPSSLKTHVRYACGQNPRFKCPYCTSITRQTSNGYAHVKKMHEGRQIYLIDIVTNKFICGSRYQPSIKTAEVLENQNLGQNDLIEKQNAPDTQAFVGIDQVEAMADDSNDEPDEPDEPIVEAEEEFGTSGTSASPKSSPEKNKPFLCPNNCGSSFSHEYSLTRHIRDQCGPPRYKCPHCFYITRQPSNVYTHIKKKHPDERIYMIDTDMNQSCDEPGSPPGDDEN